jgi:cob(I)alamin adenosyltransferase
MSPRERDEPVRLNRIYTRGGDAGETSLGDGSRVSKLDPLVRAFGAVDELNAVLGWARCVVTDPRLGRIQNELFDVGADVCVPFVEGDSRLRVTQAAVDLLEADCDGANASLQS